MATVKLSIIIAAYNEEQRLAPSLEAIHEYLQRQLYAAEVLVVDDGSTDRTVEVARGFADRLPLRVLENDRNHGKGYSVRRGMLEATGQWRLFSDADLSTPIAEIEKFWPVAEAGCDVIIGSRALPESDIELRQSWFRERLGRTFNLIIRLLGLSGIRDTQCGFKLFSAAAAERVFAEVEIEGFAFDLEALLRARRAGFEIREIPVRWINSPDSRVSVLRDASRMLYDVIRIRLKLR